MAGRNLEPFSKHTLVGLAAAVVSYYSEVYDLRDFRTVSYRMTTHAAIPNSTTPPALLFLDAGNDPLGPFEDLIPGGTGALVGNTVSGAEDLPGRYLRARVDAQNGEIVNVTVALVVRTE